MASRRRIATALGIGAVVATGIWVVLGTSEKSEPELAAAARPESAPVSPPDQTGEGSRSTTQRWLKLDVPPESYPVVWVRAGRRVEIRTEPGGGEHVAFADRKTEFKSPTVFGVVRTHGRWAGITTAALPNGQLGWVRLDSRRLRAGWTALSIVIDVSERVAAFRRRDRTLRSFPVTVGMPGAETPTGRFAVTDTFRGDLSPAYGCCALAISATQPNVPSGWLGGRRIAIHGTSGPLGVAASHGCVRAADRDVDALVKRVPLGTPVFIRG